MGTDVQAVLPSAGEIGLLRNGFLSVRAFVISSASFSDFDVLGGFCPN
jgi:hypothetical protein